MARLLVFRGETLDRELELVRLPFTIGRGPANDLVLDDPVKSVSREHAEICLEDGRYVLVDRKSENGIWVAGTRSPAIVFDPETFASVGPFRLKVVGAPPASTTGVEPTVMAGTPEEPTRRPTPAPQPRTDRVAPVDKPGWRPTPQQKLIAGGAITLLVLSLIVAVVFVRSARREAQARTEMVLLIAAANRQLDQGACAEALTQNIQPGLGRDPNNAGLLALKQRAEACLTPRPQPRDDEVDPNIALALASAKTLIADGECAAALSDPITTLLTTKPDHQDALALKIIAEGCAKGPPPPAPKPPAPVLAKAIPLEQGGLDPYPGELDSDYQTRIKAMRARYDAAVLAASKGPSRSIVSTFEGIARDATPQYLDVSEKLSEARSAFRAMAQEILAEARQLEDGAKWNEALQKYSEAREVDPSISIEAETSRINARKLADGRAACTRARQSINYGRSDAADLYRQVIALLPADEPCYAEAKQRLGER